MIDKTLITVESSCWFNEAEMKRNGNNIYTIRPIREAVDYYNEQQFQRLEADVERQRAQARLSRLCAPQKPLSTAGRPRTPPTT